MSMKYLFNDKEHLHSLDGAPLMGTSTVCGILGGGGGFTWWASGMACAKFGWLNPRLNDAQRCSEALRASFEQITAGTMEEYSKLVGEAYKAHDTYKNEAAKKGTARHEDLELYVKSSISDGGEPRKYAGSNEFIKSFADWSGKNVKKFLWSEVHCYSKKLWVGGISDVGWEDMDGRVITGDFKSSKEAYFGQFIQAAGYDLQISENGGYTADGIRKLRKMKSSGYCIIPFGADVLTPVIKYNVKDFKEAFKSVLQLYKLNQRV